VYLALATAGLSRAAGAFIRVIARLTPERMRRERWTEEIQSDAILLGGSALIMHCMRQ